MTRVFLQTGAFVGSETMMTAAMLTGYTVCFTNIDVERIRRNASYQNNHTTTVDVKGKTNFENEVPCSGKKGKRFLKKSMVVTRRFIVGGKKHFIFDSINTSTAPSFR